MIPNIFISSTISDLSHLRDSVRDAILELSYMPIMSEYGDIGYLPTESAEDSCYLAMKDCQLAVVIVGKRYGSISGNGLGVTHNEFRSARDRKIPVIFLVNEENSDFKGFVEIIFGSLEVGVPKLLEHQTLEAVLKSQSIDLKILSTEEMVGEFNRINEGSFKESGFESIISTYIPEELAETKSANPMIGLLNFSNRHALYGIGKNKFWTNKNAYNLFESKFTKLKKLTLE